MSQTYSPENCPIKARAKTISSLSAEMRRTLRKLRSDLRHCPECSAGEDCPILAHFNGQVQAAIAAVNEEWNMTSEAGVE